MNPTSLYNDLFSFVDLFAIASMVVPVPQLADDAVAVMDCQCRSASDTSCDRNINLQ